jgi:AcrR family transcriptional regulator
MTGPVGLREQHKRRTREAIGVAAMSLFFQHGYDSVTVADVARLAGVSVATVFNYFDTKEDLFFDEVDPLRAALVAAVRNCPPGESVLAALQEQVIYQLTAGRADADADEVARFHAAIVESPDLQRHEQHLQLLNGQPLPEALAALPPLIGAVFTTLRTGLGTMVKAGARR